MNLKLQIISTCDVISDMAGLAVCDVTEHGKKSTDCNFFQKRQIKTFNKNRSAD